LTQFEIDHAIIVEEMRKIAFDKNNPASIRLSALDRLGKHVLIRDRIRLELQDARDNNDDASEHVVIYLPDNGRGPVDDDKPRILESDISTI